MFFGFFMWLVMALGQLLWAADGNTEPCFEDEVYWFNGEYTGGIGWERECIPLDVFEDMLFYGEGR